MAEIDTKPPSSTQDTQATVALSEENLLALLGSSSTPASSSKPTSPAAPVAPSISEPPPAARVVPEARAISAPPPASTTESPSAVPITRIAPPTPVATPNRAVPVKKTPPPVSQGPAQPPHSQGVDSTLALLAAIKENRAGILRSDVAPKAPPHPETQVPAQEPPAKVQQSKLPEPMPAPARVPASSVAPAPLSISERIDRHPAIPTSRNAIAASAPLRGENQSRLAPSSSPAAAIDKIPGGRFTLLIVGAVIAVGGIATGLILRSHRTETPRAVAASAVPATPPAPVNNFPLQLQVEPQGKQTNVRWNPQSTLISQSREGRLVITENNQKPRTIPLGLDQLKFGHLTYQPQTDRVEFRLEVVDATGSVAEESVLSLANPPAPAAAQATTAVAASGTPQAPVGVPKSEAPPAPSAAQAPAANRPAARAFNPPAVNRSPAPGGIVDAPPEVSANVAAPEALPSAQVPRAAAPPPPTSSPRPLLVESNLQAAKLIAKVTPVYPALARSARVQGTVHFKATIGKDGSVQNLEMVGGPSILRQPAIDAVKKWKYQPTVLNGQPMEVVTSIDVTFTLGQ